MPLNCLMPLASKPRTLPEVVSATGKTGLAGGTGAISSAGVAGFGGLAAADVAATAASADPAPRTARRLSVMADPPRSFCARRLSPRTPEGIDARGNRYRWMGLTGIVRFLHKQPGMNRAVTRSVALSLAQYAKEQHAQKPNDKKPAANAAETGTPFVICSVDGTHHD